MKEQENEDEEIISLSALSFYVEEANSLNLSIDNKFSNKKNSKNKNKTVFAIDQKILDKKQKTNDLVGLTGKKRNSSNFIKSLVSKDKNRFCFDGFVLDLSYITPRIIAMGLPCTSYEAIYRNNIEDVLKFFNERHPYHYNVFNLCDEKTYGENIFYKQGAYPFTDREAPPLNMIKPFCEDAKKFLDEEPTNVIAVHCLAGKGRTGTLICCLLLYLKEFDSAIDALKYFGIMRVGNGVGVNEPSQIRYVFYFEHILKNNIEHPIIFKTIRIKKIRVWNIPEFNKITYAIENKCNNNNIFNYDKIENINAGYMDFDAGEEGFIVNGDVKIQFYNVNVFGNKEKIFKIWFNTNFIPVDGVLVVKKDLIDNAWKDQKCKKFKHNFKIEVHMIDEEF